MKNHHTSDRQIWQFPWKFKEGFLIAISLFIVGIVFQIALKGKSIPSLSYPVNTWVGIGIITILTLLWIGFRKHGIIQFLASYYAALCSLALFVGLLIIMGLFPQILEHGTFTWRLGITRITDSWMFILSFIYLLISLGMVTLKRLLPFSLKNLAFFLNHFGLFFAFLCFALGQGDIQRLQMSITEDQPPVWMATDKKNKQVELPLAIQLLDFSVENYMPTLGVVEHHTGRLLTDYGRALPTADSGSKGYVKKWSITVLKNLSYAAKIESHYVPFFHEGATYAVQVDMHHASGIDTTIWLGCGNYLFSPGMFPLDTQLSLVLVSPKPKTYCSKVKVYTQNQQIFTDSILVNHPLQIGDWTAYQFGFQDEFGRWSNVSTLELVKDVWRIPIYIGFYMMLAGIFMIVILHKKEKK